MSGEFLSNIISLFWGGGRPTILFWILVILVLALIVYIVVAILYSKQAPGDLASSPVQLGGKTQLLASDSASALMAGAGSSIVGFFNVTVGDRTTVYNPNVDNYTTLVGIPGALEFQLAPARVATNDYLARLRIVTTNPNTPDEYVNLPPFPQQKWIFLAILRDGRRFDIMYNDQIVGSHRLDHYPQMKTGALYISPSAAPKLPPRFLGTAVHIFTMNYRMSPTDVVTMRAHYSDTTGAPPPPLSFPLASILPSIDLRTFCLPGLPCTTVTQPPPNTMQMWQTLYN